MRAIEGEVDLGKSWRGINNGWDNLMLEDVNKRVNDQAKIEIMIIGRRWISLKLSTLLKWLKSNIKSTRGSNLTRKQPYQSTYSYG